MIATVIIKHGKTIWEKTSVEEYGTNTAYPDREINTGGFSGQWVRSWCCPLALKGGSQPSLLMPRTQFPMSFPKIF